MLVVECENQNIPWLEPRDLEFGEALEQFVSATPEAGNHQSEDFFYQRSNGRHAVFADGRVRFLRNGIGEKTWSALLRVDDDIVLDDEVLDGTPVVTRRLKIGNCLRLTLFVVLTLFPLPWVWLNPTSGTTQVRLDP